MQSLAEWKFGSGNVGDKKKTACKPRTASAYGRAVNKVEQTRVVLDSRVTQHGGSREFVIVQ